MTHPSPGSDLEPGPPETRSGHDYLAEIDALTSQNRARRATATECELARLRHESFAAIDPGEPLASWPPEVPDPFAGVTDQSPEVTMGDLDIDAVGGAILHHGSLIVRGFIGTSRALELADAIEQSFAARKRQRRDEALTDDDGWYTPFEPGLERARSFGQKNSIRAVDSPRILFELMEMYETTGFRALAASYLGERPAMSANKFVLRRVPAAIHGRNFHQDGAFLGNGIRTVNLWLALSHCGTGAEAAGLDLYPRRFDTVIATGGDDAMFDWTISPERAESEAGGVALTSPEFRPGDALLFDEMLVHRTSADQPCTQPRYAVESWFFASSQYPPGHTAVTV